MSYAPATLLALQAYWVEHDGDPTQDGVPLGIVGNAAHTQGYHLGRDRIYDGAGPGIGDNDYSVKLARDKAGLTNAASAIDLGKLEGSYAELRKFSTWLVAQCQASTSTRYDFREIIWSPDGIYVKRYSATENRVYISLRKNSDGSITVISSGQGDASHFGHTHISYMRDSEYRDKTAPFKLYFGEVTTPGGDMPDFKTFAKPKYVTVPDMGWIYDNPACAVSNGNTQVHPGPRDMPVSGKLATGVLIIGYVDTTPVETELVTFYTKGLTPKDYPSTTVPIPPDATSCKPFTEPLNTQITQLKADIDAAHLKGAQDEWDREAAGATVSTTVKLLNRPV